MWGIPGFATVRQQIGKASALARAEWQRSRAEEWKGWPARLAYIKKRELAKVGQYWPILAKYFFCDGEAIKFGMNHQPQLLYPFV